VDLLYDRLLMMMSHVGLGIDTAVTFFVTFYSISVMLVESLRTHWCLKTAKKS
jgi:hypothetical protein